MKWNEVRDIYPDQFVKFEILNSHFDDGSEIVDEMAIIGPVNEADATKELLKSKNNIMIYHTSNTDVVLKLRTRIGLRGRISSRRVSTPSELHASRPMLY